MGRNRHTLMLIYGLRTTAVRSTGRVRVVFSGADGIIRPKRPDPDKTVNEWVVLSIGQGRNSILAPITLHGRELCRELITRS